MRKNPLFFNQDEGIIDLRPISNRRRERGKHQPAVTTPFDRMLGYRIVFAADTMGEYPCFLGGYPLGTAGAGSITHTHNDDIIFSFLANNATNLARATINNMVKQITAWADTLPASPAASR